jgi:hypothetical protein
MTEETEQLKIKTPQQDNNNITILSTIPHPKPETIYMNYPYTHQINKA